MQIILQPVLFEPDKDILSSLEKALLKEFNASFSSSIVIAPPIKQISEQQLLLLLDNERNQWKSSDILQWLSDNYKKLYYIDSVGNPTQWQKAFERAMGDFIPLLTLPSEIKVGVIDFVIKIIGGAITFGLLAIALRRKFERKYTR